MTGPGGMQRPVNPLSIQRLLKQKAICGRVGRVAYIADFRKIQQVRPQLWSDKRPRAPWQEVQESEVTEILVSDAGNPRTEVPLAGSREDDGVAFVHAMGLELILLFDCSLPVFVAAEIKVHRPG